MLKRAYSASSSCSTPTTSSSEEADPSSLIPSTGEHGPDSMSQFSSRPDDQQSNDTMSDQEKAEKKREYNRLAQREFRMFTLGSLP